MTGESLARVPQDARLWHPQRKLEVVTERPTMQLYIPRTKDKLGKTVDAPALTPAEVQSYEDNGFVQFAGLPRDEALALGDEVRWHIEKQNSNGAWHKDGSVIWHLHEANRHARGLENLLRDPRFLGPAASILGEEDGSGVVFHHVKAFIKPAGDKSGQFPAHTDDHFYPHEDGRLAALTVHLVDITDDMGPVSGYPGTHKNHYMPTPESVAAKNPELAAEDWDPDEAVKLSGPAGTIGIHSGRIVHRSAPNRSDSPRITAIFQLRAEGNHPLRAVNRVQYPDEGRLLTGKRPR